ncbi:UdgX family uracil-DNA binding protein [Falsiroseomonas oryziterrae]|uniref:UdgX family uracil-DNA binding protein n=1 Tax=Falsiroseomonas oryziterrae TaxID=2911368 RepID=UPI001F344311|nr:UdgX family uracil-DNA binding protein [Roseomonas sp. NPKOSM-4]
MIATVLPGPADLGAWRSAARGLLGAGVPPEQAEWRVAGDAPGLFAGDAAPPAATSPFHVPRAFVALAEIAIRHRDPERFALLYRVLWRLTHGEPALMQVATDADIVRLEAMAKAVRRDAHKMHAFLRFRQVETEAGVRHVAWFEPEHHIEEAEAGFFVRRFAGLRWSIVTPRRTVHWDGQELRFGPGGRRQDVPPDDAVEPLWRAYYAAIFNPARLKPGAMRAEMPRKYWRNMPETAEIPRLIADAPRRAAEMVARGASLPNPNPQKPRHLPPPSHVEPDMDLLDTAADPKEALAALARELAGRNDLPDFARRATQLVFGEGPPGAPLMFVGEQPGDEEDIQGRPFVGPAGRLLDRALAEAEVPRGETYVTNAVKHFKFEPRGKRRLHQSPDAGDIAYYRPFLLREIGIVGPRLLVALGATALRALAGKALPVMKTRGTLVEGPEGLPVFTTVHPSFLLRVPDEEAQRREYARFVDDLRAAHARVA